jgi:tetratricopeptide (TPR) repeat protein
MQRYLAAGRVALVLGLAGIVVACGQVQNLKARKLFKDANALYQQQDYRRAATTYEEALQADPNLTVAYFYLGNSYDNLWKPGKVGEQENDEYLQKAIQNYRLAAEREQDPKMKKLALEYLVAAYGPDKLNDPDSAEPLIQSMIDLDPSDPTNYFALAKMYEDAGRYDEAEETLHRARDVRPNDAAVYMQLAGYYNRQGEFDKTMEALDMRAQREPNNPEAFYTIATFYWDKAYRDFRVTEAEKQKFAEAGIEAADRALELNPDYIDAIVYKGLLLRVRATTEKNPARQKALIDEATALQARAMDLRKQKQGGTLD